ncbi:MAG: hypothetical protein ACYDCK_03800 [Thermoplasmatota archaeon]
MLTARQAFTVGFNLLAAVLVYLIGRHLAHRRVEGPAHLASRLFVVFWYALAADTVVNMATMLAGVYGLATPVVTTVLAFFAVVAVVVTLWGLVYYLVYLFTGRDRVFWPITTFYAVSLIGGAAFIGGLGPSGVALSRWGFAITYTNEPTPLTALLFAVFFLLPPILGALAYATLAFRLREPTQRYRVVFVSSGIFIWFASSLAFSGAGVGETDGWRVVGFAIPLLAIGAIWAAYSPPAWVQRRLGVVPLEAEVTMQPARGPNRTREERRALLLSRTRELV